MNEATRAALNAINIRFYQQAATSFDESRGRDWPGWLQLLPHLAGGQPLRVLDLGCGNGRFGRFLARQGLAPTLYHGLDATNALLEAAREAFATMGILADARLEQRDLVANPPAIGEFAGYNLVLLLGFLHHIPGSQQRQNLLASLASALDPGGLLVFTTWRFAEYPRFSARLQALPPTFEAETGDYLMDWRREATAPNLWRYCHAADDAEQLMLEAASQCQLLARFRADGHSGDVNCYSALRRP
jgi:tRNA (uracil-5-)-methyltransferase TRM9